MTAVSASRIGGKGALNFFVGSWLSKRGRDRLESVVSTDLNSESRNTVAPPPRRAGHLFRRGLVGLVVLGLLGTASMLIADAMSASEDSSRMTYKVTRGELVVSVIEKGTLESSNNTEIKCKVRGFNTVTQIVPGGTFVNVGDELVRLDTKLIEEAHSLTLTNTHIATATLERTKANVAQAEISIEAYELGTYTKDLKVLERQLEIAKSNLLTSEKLLAQTKLLFKRGYVNKLEVNGNEYTVDQARLELKVIETRIKVLEDFTKKMEMATLKGNLKAARSKLQADEAGLAMELKRQARAKEELESCVILAERAGLVIYPSAAAWKDAPDVDVGATVRKDQVLLLMPDLTKMQVKVGIHESIVDRVTSGLPAIVRLPDRTLNATVSDVATVTRPSGWWTGNAVNYDTIIKLPSDEGLKPGMSAEVEVIIATHKDVLTIPVSAVVETEEGDFCWVETEDGPQRRSIQLGDSNDVFIIVKAGLKEGDEVVLNPSRFMEDTSETPAAADPSSLFGLDALEGGDGN